MPAPTGNPDFSYEAKKKIAKATRIVLGSPDNYANNDRPTYPRAGAGLFYVTLEQDGGTAGTSTTPCSFTYTVTDMANQQIGTTVVVVKDRLLNVAMNAGNKGFAFYNVDGELKIWDTNETIQQSNC